MSGISMATYTKATADARDDVIMTLASYYYESGKNDHPGLTDLEFEELCHNNAAGDVDWLLKCLAREIFLHISHDLLPDSHREPNAYIRHHISQQRRKMVDLRFKYLDK